jgi:hypothetical protein
MKNPEATTTLTLAAGNGPRAAMKLQACIEDLLLRGLDDWIQAAAVASVSHTVGGAQSHGERRELSLRLIRRLLESGLAKAGMVKEEEGFVPWDISVDEAMQRIEADWSMRPTGPGLGEVCWLSLTKEGLSRAQGLWFRKAGGCS